MVVITRYIWFEEFPTTKKELDILKYKPKSGFTLLLGDT